MRGLYAITSDAVCRDDTRLLAAAEAALRGGAALLQYRDKQAGAAPRRARAAALLKLCRAHGVPLILNDDLALAAELGADGVHLGRADAPLAQARAALGPRAVIGASCQSDLARAAEMERQGASYVAFGRFFDSKTKPDAPPARIETLRAARARLRIPVCAIGGITPDNAAPLIAAGADLIAAVEGVFGAADIAASARRYADLFK